MLNSFEERRRPRPAHQASQFIARRIVPENGGRIRGNFGQFSGQFFRQFFLGRNPLTPQASAIPEPRLRVSCGPRFDFPPDLPEAFE